MTQWGEVRGRRAYVGVRGTNSIHLSTTCRHKPPTFIPTTRATSVIYWKNETVQAFKNPTGQLVVICAKLVATTNYSQQRYRKNTKTNARTAIRITFPCVPATSTRPPIREGSTQSTKSWPTPLPSNYPPPLPYQSRGLARGEIYQDPDERTRGGEERRKKG